MIEQSKSFCADFETNNHVEDCRVWAWAVSEIGDSDNFEYGKDIDSFMSWCENNYKNVTCYFHNLKFDGSFIVAWLEQNHFNHVEDKKERTDNSYTTLITDKGQWFEIIVWFKIKGHKTNKVVFRDSLKILNFSVEYIAKKFNLPIRKLELDYQTDREVGHELTPHEVDYIRNDVTVMSMALNIMFEQGHTKMTIASDAMSDFKENHCPKFKRLFPEIDLERDKTIRDSYKGGFTYVNPTNQGKLCGSGVVLDVNSMYPSILHTCEGLPCGLPEWFEGEYEYDINYPEYVQIITCIFKIKKGKIPSVQVKSHYYSFNQTEYLTSSGGQLVTLTMTRPDLELFKEQYHLSEVKYDGGFKFKRCTGVFTDYVEKWMAEKNKAKKEDNGAMYQISKLFLNSLYGKFGTNPIHCRKVPCTIDGMIYYRTLQATEDKPIYVALASYVTAYGRKYIIETSQAIRDWSIKNKGFDAYCYSDTDSIHAILSEEDVEQMANDGMIEISDYKLGAFKVESKFVQGKWLRQKCYLEQEEDGTMNSTIAGLPKKLGKLVNFDNFDTFNTADFTDADILDICGVEGRKLRYKHTPTGVCLVPTEFKIN